MTLRTSATARPVLASPGATMSCSSRSPCSTRAPRNRRKRCTGGPWSCSAKVPASGRRTCSSTFSRPPKRTGPSATASRHSFETIPESMLKIRKAKKEDAQAAWDIRNVAILDQCLDHYAEDDMRIWTSGELSETFADMVEKHFHVATYDGQVVGTGMINLVIGQID